LSITIYLKILQRIINNIEHPLYMQYHRDSGRFFSHLSDLQEDEQVEHGQREKGREVHEDEVHPGDVNHDVVRILAQIRDLKMGAFFARGFVEFRLPAELKEPGRVVHGREDQAEGHGRLGPTIGANGPVD